MLDDTGNGEKYKYKLSETRSVAHKNIYLSKLQCGWATIKTARPSKTTMARYSTYHLAFAYQSLYRVRLGRWRGVVVTGKDLNSTLNVLSQKKKKLFLCQYDCVWAHLISSNLCDTKKLVLEEVLV